MNTKASPSPLFLVFLLGSLTALDPLTIDMYLPAFASIQQDFQTTMGTVELSVTTFFVGMALGQLLYGPLADRFGRKRPLQIGMMIYFFSTIGCALAPNIETFILFRLFQALGGCAGMVITRAIIRDLYDTKQVAIFLSNMALVMGVAPIIAPSIGAVINAAFGWKMIFWVLAAANFSSMMLIWKLLPETGKKSEAPLNFANILRTYRDILSNRFFIGRLIPDAALRAGMFAYIAGSPFVFIELMGISHSHYGLIFGMNGAGLVLASQVNRRLLRNFAPEKILQTGVVVAAIIGIVVFVSTYTLPMRIVLLGSIFVFLICLNFVSPNSLALALSDQGHRAGSASALYGCFQWSLGAVSSLFVGHFHNGTAFPMTATILLCGMVSLVSYFALTRSTHKI